jgi:nicotinamide riboside kinase
MEHGTDYTFEDLQTIANGQLRLEEKAIAEALQLHTEQQQSNKPLLIIDTDMQVMKVWCEFVFGKCHQQILDSIIARKYDGYLLCKPDLPWVKDELREYPDLETREQLYHIYKDILINQSLPWYEVHGNDPERTSGAIHWINETFQIKAKY